MTNFIDDEEGSETVRYFNGYMQLAFAFALLLLVSALSGCASISTTPPVTVDADKKWALLPFSNLSRTPKIEGQLAELVQTALRSRGVSRIDVFQEDGKGGLRSLFDDSAQFRVAAKWAQDRDQDYTLSGSIHEWQYRSGTEREPTVGLTLKLIDVRSRQVIWQGNASKTGTGFIKLSSIANELVNDLLDQISIVTIN
ncbi:MAG: hypothetical protein KTR32_34835 [Granulosicoccus sp.]|nr:hypothetical protein [Granulosicoccus sp.]